MEYITLRRGVTPAAQTPEHAERGTAVDVPLPAVPGPSLCSASIGKTLPESTKHRSQQVWMWKASTWRAGYGWEFLHHYEFVAAVAAAAAAAAAVFACLQLHLPCITIHRSPLPPPTSYSLPRVPIPYPMCQMAPVPVLTVSDLLPSVNLMQDRVATTKFASSHQLPRVPITITLTHRSNSQTATLRVFPVREAPSLEPSTSVLRSLAVILAPARPSGSISISLAPAFTSFSLLTPAVNLTA
ncbi:hypothetical protein CSIM01_10452 [Colletotrichum simmondsii]|uniref:Uncharacterized protein n=1 Tax=Colletotrichum simmondsii TaxID=703756 RepID=A0A135SQT1_9PEZI|nr:hypothetical protein CSIM01_10452 [Colletotrichum simmondsii]